MSKVMLFKMVSSCPGAGGTARNQPPGSHPRGSHGLRKSSDWGLEPIIYNQSKVNQHGFWMILIFQSLPILILMILDSGYHLDQYTNLVRSDA